MVEPLRHRQTKGAATDMPGLLPPRHIRTLPVCVLAASEGYRQHATIPDPQPVRHEPLLSAAFRSTVDAAGHRLENPLRLPRQRLPAVFRQLAGVRKAGGC
jgi:hypothetical protein